MPELLASLVEFVAICAVIGTVAAAGYYLTRPSALRAHDAGDDSVGAAILLWMHPDVCRDGPADADAGDANAEGGD